MIDENTHKHIYLVYNKNTNKFKGYSYEKSIAAGFVETREGYAFTKAKTKKLLKYIPSYDANIMEYVDGTFMTEDEETYFSESFGTFISDIVYNTDKTKDMISLLKVSDEEKPVISELLQFIENINKLYHTDCDDDFCFDEILDFDEARKWFVKNVLDD